MSQDYNKYAYVMFISYVYLLMFTHKFMLVYLPIGRLTGVNTEL